MRKSWIIITIVILITCCTRTPSPHRIPVIYSTDLYSPPMDPDDNFDLACLFSIKELDVKAIIIDNAAKSPVNPGIIPVRQIEHLSGSSAPVAVGLRHGMKSLNDDCADQTESIAGVKLILKTLKDSPEPVTIITVGSLRDVAASLNNDPKLCIEKIGRIFVFAGDASVTDPSKFREYNVDLDTLAFARVMNSGLDIYWVPCFDGGLFKNEGQASYFQTEREKLLSGVSGKVLNYFCYSLLGKSGNDHIEALDAPVDTAAVNTILKRQEGGMRNLWCSHVFPYIAGRSYVLKENKCIALYPASVEKDYPKVEQFEFTNEKLCFDLSGMVHADTANINKGNIRLFSIRDKENFTAWMTSVVADLLKNLGN
jgi:pyrimidine-specific ribonucleoside hydrolase